MLDKTFKGLTDKMLAWQTEHLQAIELGRDEYTVYVRPELVVEIAFRVKSGQIYFRVSFLGLPCLLFSIRRPMIVSISSQNRSVPVSCPRCNASRINSHSPAGIVLCTNSL
jgi:ATP-dependent DNA ligase